MQAPATIKACLRCDAGSVVYDATCVGCIARNIQRTPERLRANAWRALDAPTRQLLRQWRSGVRSASVASAG